MQVRLPDYWDHHPTEQYQAELTSFEKSATAVEVQEQLAEFVPVHRDAAAAIKKTESKMIQELLPLRHERMLASKFAFFRGTGS